MFDRKHWIAATTFLLSADSVRFASRFMGGYEGDFGAFSSNLLVAFFLVLLHTGGFAALVLAGAGFLDFIRVRVSKWLALIAPALAMGLYLTSGDGVRSLVSPWIAAPGATLILAGIGAGGWRIANWFHNSVRSPWRDLGRGLLFTVAIGLLVADRTLFVGLYLPLHFVLVALSVLLASYAIHDELLEQGRRITAVMAFVGIFAVLAVPLARDTSTVAHTRATTLGTAALQNGRIWFGLQSLVPRERTTRPAPYTTADTPLPHFGESPFHVLIISLDGIRQDRTTIGGHHRDTTPHLASVARRGWVFRNAYAPSSNTRASLNALLSGVIDTECSNEESLLQSAQDAGYRTFCDFTYARSSLSCQSTWCDSLMDTQDREQTYTHLLNEISVSDKPVFALVHLLETHLPYEGVTSEIRRKTPNWTRYERSVLSADMALGRFYDSAVAATDLPILWVIMSDHGESLGERGVQGHNSNVYEEQIHVPLVLEFPGMSPREIDAGVSTMWLHQTLRAALGEKTPGGLPTAPHDRPIFARQGQWSTVIDGRWKYIYDGTSGSEWLFNLDADPDESNNLLSTETEVVRGLRDLHQQAK